MGHVDIELGSFRKKDTRSKLNKEDYIQNISDNKDSVTSFGTHVENMMKKAVLSLSYFRPAKNNRP